MIPSNALWVFSRSAIELFAVEKLDILAHFLLLLNPLLWLVRFGFFLLLHALNLTLTFSFAFFIRITFLLNFWNGENLDFLNGLWCRSEHIESQGRLLLFGRQLALFIVCVANFHFFLSSKSKKAKFFWTNLVEWVKEYSSSFLILCLLWFDNSHSRVDGGAFEHHHRLRLIPNHL